MSRNSSVEGRSFDAFRSGVDQPSAQKRAREQAERASAAAAKREDLHALKQAKAADAARAAAAATAQVAANAAQSKQQADAQADWRRSEREAKQVCMGVARVCVCAHGAWACLRPSEKHTQTHRIQREPKTRERKKSGEWRKRP